MFTQLFAIPNTENRIEMSQIEKIDCLQGIHYNAKTKLNVTEV